VTQKHLVDVQVCLGRLSVEAPSVILATLALPQILPPLHGLDPTQNRPKIRLMLQVLETF